MFKVGEGRGPACSVLHVECQARRGEAALLEVDHVLGGCGGGGVLAIERRRDLGYVIAPCRFPIRTVVLGRVRVKVVVVPSGLWDACVWCVQRRDSQVTATVGRRTFIL